MTFTVNDFIKVGIVLIMVLAIIGGLYSLIESDDRRTSEWADKISREHLGKTINCQGNIFGDPDCTADGYPIKPSFR